MADVFLSYARKDLDRAQLVVSALEAQGWTVFWDPAILPGPRYRQVIAAEIDAARSVVVLWSRQSIDSEWVQEEAERARARDILYSALIDDVKPPLGFGQRQSANLVGHSGALEAGGIELLIQAIATRIGGRSEVRLWPVDFNIVTGCRDPHRELGPTVNVNCRVTNAATQAVDLMRLEIHVSRSDRPVYQLAWHLFYSIHGLEHVKTIQGDEQITISGGSEWERGVQFHESRADLSNVWPAGAYEFELVGWANRRPPRHLPNLRTTFRAEVDPSTERDMRRWRQASSTEWDEQGFSDRALGFPLVLTDITDGL